MTWPWQHFKNMIASDESNFCHGCNHDHLKIITTPQGWEVGKLKDLRIQQLADELGQLASWQQGFIFYWQFSHLFWNIKIKLDNHQQCALQISIWIIFLLEIKSFPCTGRLHWRVGPVTFVLSYIFVVSMASTRSENYYNHSDLTIKSDTGQKQTILHCSKSSLPPFDLSIQMLKKKKHHIHLLLN